MSPATKYSQVRARHYDLDLRRYYRLPAVQISLQVVLSIFIIAFFIFFALRPTLTTIISLQKDIEDSRQTLQQLDAKVSSLQRAATILTALKPSLSYIDASIPTTDAGYTPFISSLEILAAQSGATLINDNIGGTLLFSQIVSPFTLAKTESVVSMPVTIQVAGSYEQTSAFLTSLMSLDRIVTITSVTFSHQAITKDSTATVTLSVSGTVSYMADQKQITTSLPSDKGTTSK